MKNITLPELDSTNNWKHIATRIVRKEEICKSEAKAKNCELWIKFYYTIFKFIIKTTKYKFIGY